MDEKQNTSQDVNPNPAASSPEPAPVQQAPAPKKGGAIIKALIGVFAIAIVGFGGWYAYNSGIFGAADDNPPALSLGGGQFQGKSVETTFNFLQFDAGDVSSYQEPAGANFQAVVKGVNYFYPKSNTSFADVVDSVKPAENLKILVAFYDAEEPWAGDTSKNGCFKVYPKGPYVNTCEITESGLGSAVIGKNRGFALIASDNFEVDSNLLGEAKTLSDTLTLGSFNGWTMHPLASAMDLTDSKIKSIWVQKNANEFEKLTDVAGLDPAREFKMAWLKLGEPTAAPTADGGGTTPTPAVCGDGTVDAGEACDDGNTTAGDGCENDCTVTPAAAPVCGDGNVDAGEACDDGTSNSDTAADACRTDCTAASCGDSVVDAGETCDDGNTTAGDGCENDCTVTPAATLVCGDGVINGTEECDGTDLDNKSCSDVGNFTTGGTLACDSNCAFVTTSCTAVSAGSAAGPLGMQGTSALSGLSAGGLSLSNLSLSNLALVGDQPAGATAESNVKIENIEYIKNIKDELPIPTGDAYAYWRENLFDHRLEAQIDFDNPSSLYIREDSQASIVVTAVRVDVSSGSDGPAILKGFGFLTTGFSNSEGSITMLDDYPMWCTGSTGNWEVYKLTTDPTYGFALNVAMTHSASAANPIFSASLPSDPSQVLSELKVEPGEWAIFALVMHNMDSCHDESASNNLYSRSKTDLWFKFVDESGLDVKGTDNQTNPIFNTEEINFNEYPRWTFWK